MAPNNKNSAAGLVIMLGTVMMWSSTTWVSADPDMLQDLCVADYNSPLKVNGYACKSNFSAEDFYYAGLSGPTEPAADVDKIPGLNTLGISLERADYHGGHANPPHSHPRASEIVYVLDGTLEVGFVTTANVHVTRTIRTGDVFVFPKGLVHYQWNIAKNKTATAISAFNSQQPGRMEVAAGLFAAQPVVPDAVLAMALRINTTVVQSIRKMFLPQKQ